MKIGALLAGVGAGYMAADKWKKKDKDAPSEKGATVHRGYGAGYAGDTVESAGPDDAADATRQTRSGASYEHIPGVTGNFADGGLVGDPRWMKKTRR